MSRCERLTLRPGPAAREKSVGLAGLAVKLDFTGGSRLNDLGAGLVVGLRRLLLGPWLSRIGSAESILVVVWGVSGTRLALGCSRLRVGIHCRIPVTVVIREGVRFHLKGARDAEERASFCGCWSRRKCG